MSSFILAAVMGSSPVVGSSKKRNSGLVANALARAALFFIPPESSPGSLFAASESSTNSRSVITRSFISSSLSVECSTNGNATFSHTVSESKSAELWKSIPIFFLIFIIWDSSKSVVSTPFIIIRPSSRSRSRSITLRSTLLPQPERPSMSVVFPEGTTRFIPRRTGCSSKYFHTFTISIIS